MSADRWSSCPKCKTSEEWENEEENESGRFREDYEIGVYKGKFRIDYYVECQEF